MKKASTKSTIDYLREENASLEAEVKRLNRKSDVNRLPVKKQKSIGDWVRQVVGPICMVLAVILLVLGNLFFWVGNTLVKQDRFVAATSPVIRDQQVQQSIALYTTNTLFSTFNIPQAIAQVLPPKASFLAPQFANQLKGATQTGLQKILASPRMQSTWNTVVAKQHERIINFARTYKGNGAISLNDVYGQLAAGLGGTRLSFLAYKKLPTKVGNITVVNASWLPALHVLVNDINTWRLLSLLGFALFIFLSVWFSQHKRRTVYLLGLFCGLGLAISLVVLRAIRERIIDKVNPLYVAGVRQALQIIFHGLVIQTVTIMISLILLGCIVWLSGNSRGAMSTRRQVLTLTNQFHNLIFWNENKFTQWVGRYRRMLEWGVVAIFVILMLFSKLTITAIVVYVILIVLSVLAIEALGNQAGRSQEM